MSDSFETLMWEYILEHNISGLGDGGWEVDGVPQLVFYSPRFGNLFYRIFAAGANWRWGLIDLGYFNTRRILHMEPYRVRFAPRLDNVQRWHFDTYGLALMYYEIEELYSSSSSDE